MTDHSYFNYPQIFNDCEQHFELVLLYIPRPDKNSPARLEKEVLAALQSTAAVPLWLPSALRLMMAGQLQMLATEGFGELSTTTFSGKQASRRMRIQMGTSYQKDIQREELGRIEGWFSQVIHDWSHQQCQRSPKRHFPMIDQQNK